MTKRRDAYLAEARTAHGPGSPTYSLRAGLWARGLGFRSVGSRDLGFRVWATLSKEHFEKPLGKKCLLLLREAVALGIRMVCLRLVGILGNTGVIQVQCKRR